MNCPVVCYVCKEVVELSDCRGSKMLCGECRMETKHDAEWVIEQMAETIVSHPGNMRCLRLEVRIDEVHDPVWTIYAIDRRGRKFSNVGQGDDPERAMERFWANRTKEGKGDE